MADVVVVTPAVAGTTKGYRVTELAGVTPDKRLLPHNRH